MRAAVVEGHGTTSASVDTVPALAGFAGPESVDTPVMAGFGGSGSVDARSMVAGFGDHGGLAAPCHLRVGDGQRT